MLPVDLAAVALKVHLWAAALVLCGETRGLEDARGPRFAARERASIVELARGRARDAGTTLLYELGLTGQFAASDACGAARLRRYAALADGVVRGKIKAPRWAKRARRFTNERAARAVTRSWARQGFRPIRGTRTVHVYFEPTAKPSKKGKGVRRGR